MWHFFPLSENFVIMWKKVDESNSGNPPQFLAIGESIMNKDKKRFSVEISKVGSNKGSTLVIGLADEGDAGQYVCELGSTDKRELKHTVKVRGEFSKNITDLTLALSLLTSKKVEFLCSNKSTPQF